MNGFLGFLAVLVLVGLGTGFFYFQASADDENSQILDEQTSSELAAAREARRNAESAQAQATQDLKVARFRIDELSKEADALREGLKAAEARGAQEGEGLSELKAKLTALEEENETLKNQLGELRGPAIEAVLKRFQELKGKGFQLLLQGNELGKLVADLRTLGPEGIKAVLGLLQSGDANEKLLAISLVSAGMGSPEMVDPLKEASMKKDGEGIATMAARALMMMDDKNVVPALKDIVKNSEDEGAKVNSMFGLCRHGDQEGVDQTLAYFQNEKNPSSMRNALGQSFMILSDPSAIPLVDAATKKYGGNYVGSAVDWYAKVGTPAAMTKLQEIANNASYSQKHRNAAQAALNSK